MCHQLSIWAPSTVSMKKNSSSSLQEPVYSPFQWERGGHLYHHLHEDYCMQRSAVSQSDRVNSLLYALVLSLTPKQNDIFMVWSETLQKLLVLFSTYSCNCRRNILTEISHQICSFLHVQRGRDNYFHIMDNACWEFNLEFWLYNISYWMLQFYYICLICIRMSRVSCILCKNTHCSRDIGD